MKTPNIRSKFHQIIEDSKDYFWGHLTNEIYIDIKYNGWIQRNLKKYTIKIYTLDVGCVYEEVVKLKNKTAAIEYAVEESENWIEEEWNEDEWASHMKRKLGK